MTITAADLSEAALDALREMEFSSYDAETKELQKHGLITLSYDWNPDDGFGGDEYEVWTLTPAGEALARGLVCQVADHPADGT